MVTDGSSGAPGWHSMMACRGSPARAAAVTNPPNPNAGLDRFVKTGNGVPYFDVDAWNAFVASDAAWTNAAWTDAAWTDAAWTDAAWTDAAWTDAAWTEAAWTDASVDP